MTLTAKGKIKELFRLDLDYTLLNFEIEFDSISDLEHFISYNRAQLVEISFSGKLNSEREI